MGGFRRLVVVESEFARLTQNMSPQETGAS